MFRRAHVLALIVLFAAGCRGGEPYGLVTTLAGHSRGLQDATGRDASFNQPDGIATGADGTIYVADTYNHRVRAITPDGAVTTLAGGGESGVHGGGLADGPGLEARFRFPRDVACDGLGHLYVADTNNCRVCAIDLTDPAHPVTTIAGAGVGYADGPGKVARFEFPWGIAVGGPDPGHPDIYVSDTYNHRIRRIDGRDPAHAVTTVAGGGAGGLKGGSYADGPGLDARFKGPRGLAVDWHGDRPAIFVADASNQAIRRIDLADPKHPTVATMGGTHTAASIASDLAPLIYPTGVVVRHEGDRTDLFAVDSGDGTIYRIALDGRRTWLVGGARDGANDGFWRGGQFHWPSGIAEDPRGRLLVTDTGNNRIRVVI